MTPTIQPAAGSPTTMPAQALAAVQICHRDGTGQVCAAPGFGVSAWPAWQVRAFAALLAAPADPGAVQRMRGWRPNAPAASALQDAARALLGAAEHCRRARWKGREPYRLSAGELFCSLERVEYEAGHFADGYSVSMLSHLLNAHEALTTGQPCPEFDPATYAFAAGSAADIVDFVLACARYASVPPSTEGELAGQGYTAAEFLLDQIAARVVGLASAYATVRGARAAEFRAVAPDAAACATAARKTIEQGVKYTLAGQPLDFAA